ncbi:MAG: polysaccharide deacetylase family protein [Candidatus Poribacteria bacterium]|nr:polysaccharide deacetylase family protein [Candidatus Poribacteria bacterium]
MKETSTSIQGKDNIPIEWLPILAYHKIGTQKELGITWIAPSVFEKQIAFLHSEQYQTVSPNDLTEALLEKRKLPEKSVMITFDDGYESCYTHAFPILKRYGFTATIFMLAGYVGKWNSWDARLGWKRFKHLSREQIIDLDLEGFTFGSHGLNHLFLTLQHHKTIQTELKMSKSILEDILQKPIDCFAYPYGNHNSKTTQLVKEANYRIAFSLNPSPQITNSQTYYLPRMGIYLWDTLNTFKTKLRQNGEMRFRIECTKNILINRLTYGNLIRFYASSN